MLGNLIAALVLFCLTHGLGLASESVTLSFAPRADRVIDSTTQTFALQKINITGDDQVIEMNRARGVTFPVHLQTTETQTSRLWTGRADTTGSYPMSIEYLSANSQTVNQLGYAIPMKAPAADLVGMRINATVLPNGSIEFGSIENGNGKPELIAMAPRLLSAVFESMKSLDGVALNVGDSRTQDFTFDMPLPGVAPIRFSGQMVYKLISVSGGIAKFSTATTYTLQQPEDGISIQAKGSGFGSMEYDAAHQHNKSMISQTSMQVSVHFGKGLMTADLTMRQSITFELQK